MPRVAPRPSTLRISRFSSAVSPAATDRATAHAVSRQAGAWRWITSSIPGFSRSIACSRPPGTSTSRGGSPARRAVSVAVRTTKSPTSRKSMSVAASAPKPSGPLATTTGRSRRSGARAPSSTARSIVAAFSRSGAAGAEDFVRPSFDRGVGCTLVRRRGGTTRSLRYETRSSESPDLHGRGVGRPSAPAGCSRRRRHSRSRSHG